MSKTYRLYQVDSFTKQLFLGNPAGVISNADGLTEEEMQKIARELNNSETAFILSPNKEGCDVHVRFFTPSNEVPICGHATIAAHFIRAIEERYTGTQRVFQNTGAGILPVDITEIENSYKVTMTQGTIDFGNLIEGNQLERLISALKLTKDDLIKNAPVQIVSTGHSKVMIGINDYKLLHNMNPDLEILSNLSSEIGCNGYYIFTFDTNEPETLIKGRMFAPAIGINEDPVTGNANGPLGAYIIKYDLVEHNNPELFKFTAKQGATIGREGSIEVEVSINNGEPKQVKVSGSAVIAFKSELII
jgi:PhzF family phenazine biosynthesis protein